MCLASNIEGKSVKEESCILNQEEGTKIYRTRNKEIRLGEF